MFDRDTVISRIETICEICKTNKWQTVFDSDTIYPILTDALALLKEHDEEVKAAYRRGLESGRIIKWD